MRLNAKKKLSLLLAIVMLVGALSGCGGNNTANNNQGSNNNQPSNNGDEGGDTNPAVSGGKDVSTTAERDPNRPIKDTLTIALYEEPNSLDPQGSTLSGNSQVYMNIYDSLFVQDAEGEIHPNLATSYEQVDDLTYTIHLRDDVTWHNGDKFTADDVVYSINRIATMPATTSRYGSLDTENTVAIDDYTVELKLKEPWGNVITYLAGASTSIVNPNVAEDPDANMDRNPVGTGPYKFVSWSTGDNITLVRNEDYWGEPAVTENIIIKFFPDANIRAVQLETGTVDFYYLVGETDYERLVADPDIVVSAAPGYTHENLYFSQVCESVFNDVNVRKAMTYALDMPAIVEAVWGPLGEAAQSIYVSSLEGFVKLRPVERDVEYAKQILADAGYEDGIEGEMYFPNNSIVQAYTEIMQAQWMEAGINIKINSLDQASVKELNSTGKNPAGKSNFTVSSGDPVAALAAWEIGYSGVMQPQDEYIDSRIKQCRASSDPEERAKLLEEIQRYALEEMYYAIPVAFIDVSYAMSKDVFGFEFQPAENVYFRHMGVYAD